MRKNQFIISKLRELNLDFNDLFILECFYYEDQKQFFEMYEIPSIKDFNISSRYQSLKKMGLLVSTPGDSSKIIISVKGRDLLEELYLPEPLYSEKEKITTSIKIVNFASTPEECFEEWWKAYPTTPTWATADKQRKFIGSRNLKNLTKDKARKRYLELLNQGLKHEDLLGSLKYEITLKKIDSIKKNENQMDYFKGMESYFNEGRYMHYIESYQNDPGFINNNGAIKAKTSSVTDI